MKFVAFAGLLLSGILVQAQSSDTLLVSDTVIGASSSSAIARIAITSEPAGAAILLDNISRGFTPDTLDSVLTGTHDLRLRLAGYYVKKASVSALVDSMATYSYVLVKPANVTIKSEPDSAQIVIGGKTVGVTPFVDDKFKPGSIELVFKKSGFADTALVVTVASGATDTFNVMLKSYVASHGSAKKPAVASTVALDPVARKDQYKPIAIAVFAVFTAALILIELMGP